MRSDLYKPNLDNLTTAQLLSLARQLGVPEHDLEFEFELVEDLQPVNFELVDDDGDDE